MLYALFLVEQRGLGEAAQCPRIALSYLRTLHVLVSHPSQETTFAQKATLGVSATCDTMFAFQYL